jgi:L-2-amino-thiazoline-4-carboxylic acid hydrolase-like protein
LKKIFRFFIGFIVAIPFAVIIHLLSVFIGKQRAVEKLGPFVTMFAKSMQQFFPPKINNASEFDLFKSRVKGRQKFWGILYDYPIEYPDEDSVQLLIQNCPFAEAANYLKISEIGPYMCQGDREVAKDNSEKWSFERKFQIGTGDKICDFKYIRIEKEND